jgi:putative endopeptidase
MLSLVNNLKLALGERIKGLTWMSAETKAKAEAKLAKINVKIGYPDKWRDYSALNITRDSYVQNVLNASKFEFKRNLDKIGKPVDRNEWGMTPQTVNAYYSPNMNEIVFPAAILQPPFFDMNADDAVNYGAIGVVIGHEMTHGFDDQGKQYDKDGNLQDWWTAEDAKKFADQVAPLVAHADGYKMTADMNVNGKLTLGENIADFGGLTVSLTALRKATNNNVETPKIDGFTPLQRYFISYAQVWRQNIREKDLMRRLKEDVHSPADYRVNGALPNIPEFYTAFGIKESDKLYLAPDKRALIW